MLVGFDVGAKFNVVALEKTIVVDEDVELEKRPLATRVCELAEVGLRKS